MRKKARPTTKHDETPEFVQFWSVWQPHKRKNDGRGEARDEFFRHVDEHGADPQDIVDGAKWAVKTWDDFKFFPLAKSWLNKRDYEDGCIEWRNYEARKQARANVVEMRPKLNDNHFLNRFKAEG